MPEPTPEVSAGSEADSGIQKQVGPLKLWQWAAVLVGAFLVYRVIRGSGSSSSGDTTVGPVTTGNDPASAVGLPTAADFANLTDAIKGLDTGNTPVRPRTFPDFWDGHHGVADRPGFNYRDHPGISGSGSGGGSSGGGGVGAGASSAIAPAPAGISDVVVLTAPAGTSSPTIVSATQSVVGTATSIIPASIAGPIVRESSTVGPRRPRSTPTPVVSTTVGPRHPSTTAPAPVIYSGGAGGGGRLAF